MVFCIINYHIFWRFFSGYKMKISILYFIAPKPPTINQFPLSKHKLSPHLNNTSFFFLHCLDLSCTRRLLTWSNIKCRPLKKCTRRLLTWSNVNCRPLKKWSMVFYIGEVWSNLCRIMKWFFWNELTKEKIMN